MTSEEIGMPDKKTLYLFLIIVTMLSSCSNASEQTNEKLRVVPDIAGYKVTTLTYIPAEFLKVPYVDILNNKTLVRQTWRSEKPGHYLVLEQGPNLRIIGKGKPTEIKKGVQGREYLIEPTGDSLPEFTLYWMDGEMGYILTGTLDGSINEKTIYKIAKSVR